MKLPFKCLICRKRTGMTIRFWLVKGWCDSCDKEQIRARKELAGKGLRCFIDGNALCVTGKDFVDLQESETMFFPLLPDQLAKLKELRGE